MYPWSSEELEKLLREFVARGVEGPKVDFKQALTIATAADKVELAKDLSAIANTDADDGSYHGYGFIVFGAARGEIVGGVDLLAAGKHDNTSSSVTNVLKEYLGPVPLAHLCAFEHPGAGPWGAFVIPPSNSQPHVFVRELNGKPRRGDWFVRVNDVTELARPEDHARILATATLRATRPLERQLQELETRLRLLEHRPAHALAAVPTAPAAAAAAPTAAASIADMLRSAEDQLEEQLIAEAQKVRTAISSSDALPWVLNGVSAEQQIKILDTLEGLARPLVDAIGTVLRYDRNQSHANAVVQAVATFAEESGPPHGVGYQPAAQHVRFYPLILALHTLAAITASTGRFTTFRRVLDLRVRPQFDHDRSIAMIDAYRYLFSATPIFQQAAGERNVVPISVRMRDVLPSWLAPLLVGTAPLDAFYVAEFLIGLLAMGCGGSGHFGRPTPGAYMYFGEARAPIRRFLASKPAWLESLLGCPPPAVLAAFDQLAPQVANRGFPSGVYDGTAEMFGGRPAG